MTIPIERSWAVENTRDFLYKLLDPKQSPRIPKSIRQEARWCLKHFPTDLDMEHARKFAPEVFGKEDQTFLWKD